MSNKQRIPNRKTASRWILNGLILLLLNSPASSYGQDILAYAKPIDEYVYIYTLDHEYETTLFRSEQFDPILETEDGYIIQLKLGGNPKLVLLPFHSQNRRVAEEKFRGVGVTYTAYLTFTEGHLPFEPNQYYEVVKQENGMLHINFQLNDFNKVVPVPESSFIVRTSFEYQLEQSLTELRKSYRNLNSKISHPDSWKNTDGARNPGTLTQGPTHVAVANKQIFANNSHSIRTVPAKELKDILTETRIGGQRLLVAPIEYTFEKEQQPHYFVRVQGYEYPVLIKELKIPEEGEGYSKIVRVTSKDGRDVRLLEVTDSVHIEFHPNFQFLSPGTISAVRKDAEGHFLIASEGEYRIEASDFQVYTPKKFIQNWFTKTSNHQLHPGDDLFSQFLHFKIPPTTHSVEEWKLLGKLRELALLHNEISASTRTQARGKASKLTLFETKAQRLGLSFKAVPRQTDFPVLNACYFNYWKKNFEDVSQQASKEKNHNILKHQILRAKILIGETRYQTLVDFLSDPIYTFSNFLPAPLNRINQLDSNPPFAAANIITFDFPLDHTFKLNPVSLDPIALQLSQGSNLTRNQIKKKYQRSWLLDTDILQIWRSEIIAKLEMVYDPAYRQAIEDKLAAEKAEKVEVALRRMEEAQAIQLEAQNQLENAKLPWIAVGIWFTLLFLTNSGFFALSKVMPVKQS